MENTKEMSLIDYLNSKDEIESIIDKNTNSIIEKATNKTSLNDIKLTINKTQHEYNVYYVSGDNWDFQEYSIWGCLRHFDKLTDKEKEETTFMVNGIKEHY